MAIELASAYVTIIPSLDGASKAIQSGLEGIDLSSTGDKMGASLGSSMSKGVSAAAKGIATALGAIGGAIGSLAATGGMSRALNIQQAQTMFKGLKLEWAEFSDTIETAVTGTAFGMDQAALVAAGLAASGVKAGSQMEKALNGAVGAAATFGADLGDLGGIFQKVAAQGKLTGDNLFQMSARGINGLSVLSEYLGKSQEEVSKMVSQGKIDFETFSDAMYAAFGDSAKGANDTFTGSLTNMKAALSRFGQMFATPIVENAPKLFTALKDAINGLAWAAQPIADAFGRTFVSAIEKVSGKIGAFNDKIKELKEKMAQGEGPLTRGAALLEALRDTFSPLQLAIGGVASAFVGLGAAFGVLSSVASVVPGLSSLVGVLGGLAGGGGTFALITSGVSGLGAALGGIPGMLSGVVAGFGNWALTIPAIGPALNSLQAITGIASSKMGTAIWNCFEMSGMAIANFGAKLPIVGGAFSSLGTHIGTMGSSFTLAGGNMSALGNVITSVMGGPFKIVLGVIAAIVAAFAVLYATNEDFRNSMNELGAQLMTSLKPAFDSIMGSLGKMADAVLPAITSLLEALTPFIVEIVTVVAQGLATVLPVIANGLAFVVDIIATIVTAVASAITWFSEWLSQFQSFGDVINAFCEFAGGLWNSFWTGLLEFATQLWDGIVSGVVGFVTSIQSNWDAFLGNIAALWNFIWSGICSFAQGIWDAICGLVLGAASAIQGTISGALSAISSLWNSIWSAVSSTVSSVWSTVTSTVSSGVESVIGFIGTLPQRILAFFADAGSWLIDAGRSIINGLVSGIQSAIGGAIDAVAGAVGQIRNLFPFSPAKEGPFSGRGWVLYSGMSIMEAVGEGVERQAQGTLSSIRSVMGDIQSEFSLPSPGTPMDAGAFAFDGSPAGDGGESAIADEAILQVLVEILNAIPNWSRRDGERFVKDVMAHA